MNEWAIAAAFGFGAGILSAWGIGGGTLLLLCMTLFLHMDSAAARAVNLLFFLPTAGAGLIFHVKKGLVDRSVFRAAALPGMAAAVLGRPFGIFLLYAGARLLWKVWKESKQPPA